MEKWDLYDKDFKKLNKTVIRGEKLGDDEYHLVINAWIVNNKGEFLITRRSPNKSHPKMWECTGGSALCGETPLDACAREIKEELDIDIDVSTAKFIGKTNRYYPGCPDILCVYLFVDNTPLSEVHIQEEEVMDVMWASADKIRELRDNHSFEANALCEEVLSTNY